MTVPASAVDELIAFVRAALDEDERVARAAIADDSDQDGGFEDADWLTNVDLVKPRFGAASAELIRTFAVPRRQLAEVEAKRERLDWIESQLRDDATDETAQWLAKLEAQPYAGWPGWREAWRV